MYKMSSTEDGLRRPFSPTDWAQPLLLDRDNQVRNAFELTTHQVLSLFMGRNDSNEVHNMGSSLGTQAAIQMR